MAGAAAKKAQKAKARASSAYLPVIVAANVWYVVVRLVLRRASATRWHLVGLVAAALTQAATFQPAVDATTGPSGSLGEYFFDVLVLAVVAEALGALTDYAWFILLVIPAFAAYKAATLWASARKTMAPAASTADDDDDDDDKGRRGGKEKKVKRRTIKTRQR